MGDKNPRAISEHLLELSDDALIQAHLRAEENAYNPAGLRATDAGLAMLGVDPGRRGALVARALRLWITAEDHKAGRVASDLLRVKAKEWKAEHLVPAVEAAATLDRSHRRFGHFSWFPHKPLVSALEGVASKKPLPAELRAALETWKAAVSPRSLTPAEERELGEAERVTADDNEDLPWSKVSVAWETNERLLRIGTPLTEERKLIERLDTLLSANREGGSSKKMPAPRIDATDAVGAAVAADIAKGARAAGADWAALLNHARAFDASIPSKKWLGEAARLVAAIKPDFFRACVSDWFNCVGKPARQPRVSYGHQTDQTLLNDCSVEVLKGVAWVIVAAEQSALAPALGTLAEACFQKIRDKGPRSVKLGNAAVSALAALGTPETAAQLTRLRLRVKHRSSRATVDKALAAVSKKTGLSPDDLAEMSVPTFGLNNEGVRHEKLAGYIAELRVAGSHGVELRFLFPDGKAAVEVPAKIKTGHADALKRLKREAKDASIMLAAQALRLERLFVGERGWPLTVWRDRYLRHPLVGTLAQRLIWQFDDTPAIPHNGHLVTADGRKITPKNSAAVSLWHPINAKPEQVLGWRQWLERNEVTQPFKQAHREIYLLTDAERKTGAYSNRFAAHILRQHQFAALCQQRGRDYSLQGEFDSHSVPKLRLPSQGLTAEFWVEAIENEISSRGIYLYVSTDQVRFGRPLDEVPPAVFSEVMRDVDLFVSVSSVGADPTWNDGSDRVRGGRAYWEHFSFGELSETAKTRKSVLERLLPRLKAPDRFSLSDKFLIVRGSLRTYKIHLGSGNILMEPNDQYLCIVPNRGKAASKSGVKVFLPFEGDQTLSIILSKAFLLAEDTRIKDETILRQIKAQ